ncbi:MAG: hypothetical protein ACR2QE_03985 [Acidimicrobiales bacterium]
MARRTKGGRTTPKGTRPESAPARPADRRSGKEPNENPAPSGHADAPGHTNPGRSGPRGTGRDIPPRKPA